MIQVIPAMDILEGKCVRLTQGDFSRSKTYALDPLEFAGKLEKAGLRRLHLVDLDGARQGKVVNWKVLEDLASATSLDIDFGGGLKTSSDLQRVFDCGARMAAVGSMAVRQPELFRSCLALFGGDRIFLGADVKDEKLALGGWQEQTDLFLLDFLRQNLAWGVTRFFCTDISRDGLMAGPSLDLYRKVLGAFPGISLVASGGVRSLQDIRDLEQAGLDGVILGKALYEGQIGLPDLVFPEGPGPEDN